MKLKEKIILDGNKLIDIFMDSSILDYKNSGMKDINGIPILEGSIINANGYKSDLNEKYFHCVEFHDGIFGSNIFRF